MRPICPRFVQHRHERTPLWEHFCALAKKDGRLKLLVLEKGLCMNAANDNFSWRYTKQ